MSKILKLEFKCNAPIIDAFIVQPSQIPELKKEQDLEGYDWITVLQDFHSNAVESLSGGIDIDGCTVSAELDGEAFPISGISTASTEKDLNDDEYTSELEWQRDEIPLEDFIKSELIVSFANSIESGHTLQPQNGDYVILSFTETKFSSYSASIEVDDTFILHDLDLLVGNFDSDLEIAKHFYGHHKTRYQQGDYSGCIENPILSISYKDECFPIEQDFTSYAPLFECFKFENGKFLPAEELSDFFNGM